MQTIKSSGQKKKRKSALKAFFARPPALAATCLWAGGAVMLGGAITAAALDIGEVRLKLAYAIATALVLLYALYATAALPAVRTKLKRAANGHRLIHRFLNSAFFRAAVFTCGSMLLDVSYAVPETIIGAVYGLKWHTVNGIYYFSLAVMRGCLVIFGMRQMSKEPRTERRADIALRAYIVTGAFLLATGGALSALTYAILYTQRPTVTVPVLVYATAVYTFFKMAVAGRNIIFAGRTNDYTVRAARNIGLVGALVSLLALETSLAATFGDVKLFLVTDSVFAGLISLFSNALALFMIINGARKRIRLHAANSLALKKSLLEAPPKY